MSEGYRNGAFALGLVTGLGLTLNLVLWLDLRSQKPRDQSANADGNEAASQVGHWWGWLIETFVNPYDTLAQWIMTIFTIVAVILVWLTYSVTRRMAEDSRAVVRDTREIGEKQVRAYVSIQSIQGERIPKTNGTRIVVVLKNTGASPAFRLKVIIKRQLLASLEENSISFWPLDLNTSAMDLGAGETRTVSVDISDLHFDTVEWLRAESGCSLYCFVYARYFDAFKRDRMRRTLMTAKQFDRFADQPHNLIFAACDRGNRSS